MNRTILAAGALALVLTHGLAAAEADWPQFRGPNRDNISRDRGLLRSWPAGGPRLLWKTTGIGGGYSSVAVAGDRIYTLGNKGRVSQLHALDRESGKLAWSVDVGPAGGNLGSTPTVDGDRVYAVGQEGDLVCVDTRQRKVVWSRNYKKEFDGRYGGWKYTESILIDGDRLICTPGGPDAILAALDKKTGKTLWQTPSPFSDPTAGYSSVVITRAGNVRQYVQLTAGGVLGVKASDGTVLWKYEKFAGNTANIPTPIIVRDNQVFTAAGYGRGGALLALSGDGRGGVRAREVYFQRALTNKHGGLVIVDGHVYGDQDERGTPYCASVKTGKVLWKRNPDEGQGSGSASVTYADGHLYFLYQNGTMALVRASTDGYEEKGSFKVPGIGSPAWAHPVVVGGKLYLRGSNVVFCYDVQAR